MTPRWLGAIGVLLLASTAAAQNVESCTVGAEPSRRLELPDGRIASVDVKSVAASGGSIMALGRHVHLFPRGATPTTPPTPPDSIIGVVIDGRGVVSPVTSPLPDRSVSFARVAAGPLASFHVLFVTGIDSLDHGRLPRDTASLWYASYANGAWRATERVTETFGASLNPEFTSELLEREGSLSFVFPFVDDRDTETRGGLIALRRRNGQWSADTLRTWNAPAAVRAAYTPDAALAVLIAQLSRGALVPDVFFTRLGTRWEAPLRIGGNGVRPVSDLGLAVVPGGMAATWGTWEWLNAETNVVEWTRSNDAAFERSSRAAVIDSGTITYPFEFLAAGPHLVWLYHGEPLGLAASFTLATGDRMARGSLTIPFHNARARAIARSPGRILVFTMKRGRADAEPMMASWTTEVRIRCPDSARR